MRITGDAEDDIDRQIDCDRRTLSKEIRERLSPPRDNENVRYIDKPGFGIEFHRLKIKDGQFDHRVYFDYIDSELVVFAVRHRDYSYTEEDLADVADRLSTLQAD